jgi:hypothetical protein
MGMSRTVRLAAAFVVCSAVTTGFALAGSDPKKTNLRQSAKRAFSVASSLDGKAVLPVRIRWIAQPGIPVSQVADVDFLIDGNLHWVEHNAPYVYGGDDNGRNESFLFTTWLTPGEHRFTVSVTDTNGTEAADTVTARVLAAQQPPAALVGTWTRVVTVQDAQDAAPQYGGAPPVGRWELVFDRVGAWELDPTGGGLVNGYDAERGVIHVYAPIQMTPGTNGGGGISRFGHRINTSGGTDCTLAGPFGTYRWAVTGTTLALTAIREGCPDRGAVWVGTWTRNTPAARAGGSNG